MACVEPRRSGLDAGKTESPILSVEPLRRSAAPCAVYPVKVTFFFMWKTADGTLKRSENSRRWLLQRPNRDVDGALKKETRAMKVPLSACGIDQA